MDSTSWQQLGLALPVLSLVVSVAAMIGCAWTWATSRAYKVRTLERHLRDRSDATEVKLAEWHTSVTAMLAEAEEFFDRSVKERKRARGAESRLEATPPAETPLETLSRADQLKVVRGHFAGR